MVNKEKGGIESYIVHLNFAQPNDENQVLWASPK